MKGEADEPAAFPFHSIAVNRAGRTRFGFSRTLIPLNRPPLAGCAAGRRSPFLHLSPFAGVFDRQDLRLLRARNSKVVEVAVPGSKMPSSARHFFVSAQRRSFFVLGPHLARCPSGNRQLVCWTKRLGTQVEIVKAAPSVNRNRDEPTEREKTDDAVAQ